MLKKTAAVNSKSPEIDDVGIKSFKKFRKVFLKYVTTVYTGKNTSIMSPKLNLKIDNILTGYENQQQITGLRTV